MTEPLPENELATIQLVELAVACFVGHVDDRGVSDALGGVGLSRETVDELVVLVPSAFGHALLQHKGLLPPATFIPRTRGDRQGDPRPFGDEPIYRAAAEVAKCAPRDVFRHLAEWSSEIHAIRELERSGRPLAGGRFAPPLAYLPHLVTAPSKWWRLGLGAKRPPRAPDPLDWHGLGRILVTSLEAHGLPVQQHGAAAVDSSGTRWEARILARAVRPDGADLQVDFVLSSAVLGPGRLLFDSFAGVGKTVQAAALEAYDKFALGTLHVLLTDVAGRTCCAEQTDDELWSERWHARWGSLLRLWSNEPEFDAGPLLDAVRDAFIANDERERIPHWIRVFVAFGGKVEPTFEALLDNEHWPELHAVLERWPFPASERPYALRLFVLVTPVRSL